MRKLLLILNLLIFNIPCFASANFTSSEGNLVIPDVSVNGDKNYSNVTLHLDFDKGTFKVLDAQPKTTTISDTPLQSQTLTFNFFENYKFDFFGCERSGQNQISCYVDVTMSSDYPRLFSATYSLLFDNQGREYLATVITISDTPITFDQRLPSKKDTPIRIKYIFDNFNIHAASISVFKPTFYDLETYGGDVAKNYFIEFRNISF